MVQVKVNLSTKTALINGVINYFDKNLQGDLIFNEFFYRFITVIFMKT